MGGWNQTSVTEFTLASISTDVWTQILLFVLFLLLYILIICGNVILICAVTASPHMHTPMYYFLCNLSILDMFYSSVSIPKILVDMFTVGGGRISLIGCMIQMNISLFLGETECILLAVMAYDRYIAICFPLRYTAIMSWKVCRNISVLMWLGCLLSTNLPTTITPITFCAKTRVNHFVCEILAILKVACGNMSYLKVLIFFSSLFTLVAPFAFILTTYMCIMRSILKIKSMDGRKKSFSTCASHLTVVLMFYGTSMTMYLGLERLFPESQKYVSIIYGVVTPALNPLIYSLRNNDVKAAIMKIWGR